MPLRVRQAQGDAPRRAGDDPAVDPQVLAQRLDVPDQVLSRVRREVGGGTVGQRPAPAAAALVQQDAAVGSRVEVPANAGTRTRAWAAVQPQRRGPGGVADRLPVDLVAAPDGQQPGCVWLDGRILLAHGGQASRREARQGSVAAPWQVPEKARTETTARDQG